MALNFDEKKYKEDGDFEGSKETKVIPAGFNLCRLTSYIELGHHNPIFKGKRATFDQGKRAGEEKPAEMLIMLTFEFPLAERTGDFPLTIKTSIPFGSGSMT